MHGTVLIPLGLSAAVCNMIGAYLGAGLALKQGKQGHTPCPLARAGAALCQDYFPTSRIVIGAGGRGSPLFGAKRKESGMELFLNHLLPFLMNLLLPFALLPRVAPHAVGCTER